MSEETSARDDGQAQGGAPTSAVPDEAASRRIPRRIVGVSVLLFGAAMLVTHLFARTIVRSTPPRAYESVVFGLTRVGEIVDALPAIAARDRTALFIGPSTTMQGITPQVFDEEMQARGVELSSYNLGALAMRPDNLLLLARRVRDAYAKSGKRASAVFLEVCPHGMTDPPTAVARHFDRVHLFKRARLATPAELMRGHVQGGDLQAGLRGNAAWVLDVLVVKLLGGVDQAALIGFSGEIIDELTGSASKPGEEELIGKRLWDAMAATNGGRYPHWDRSTRGDFQRLLPGTADDYRRLVQMKSSDAALRGSHNFHVKCCDIDELRVPAPAVEEFRETIATVREFADHVFVYVIPRNAAANVPTPAGKERIATLLAAVQGALDTPIIDLGDDPAFGRSDFFDISHMNELGGRKKLSVRMADEVAKRWPVGARP